MPRDMNLHMLLLRALLRFSNIVGLIVLVCALFPEAYIAQETETKHCPPSSCGNIGNISYPFHLKGHPPTCGDSYHELACHNNRTTLDLYGVQYYVQDISYENRSIRVVPLLSQAMDQCSVFTNSYPIPYISTYRLFNPYDYIFFVSCASPVNSSNYISFSSCDYYFQTETNSSSYVVLNVSNSMDIHDSCEIISLFPNPFIEAIPWNITLPDIQQQLLRGFQLEFWDYDQLENKRCFPSSCGSIGNISYPFFLRGHPRSCGDGYHELACENNRTTLDLYGIKYYVQEISYENQTIRLVDANINNDYCSIPGNSFPFSEFGDGSFRHFPYPIYEYPSPYENYWPPPVIVFVSCASPVNTINYLDFSPCVNGSSTSSSSNGNSSSYVVLYVTSSFEIHISCTINIVYPSFRWNLTTISDIQQELLRGFSLSFQPPLAPPYAPPFAYDYQHPLWISDVLLRYKIAFQRWLLSAHTNHSQNKPYSYFLVMIMARIYNLPIILILLHYIGSMQA